MKTVEKSNHTRIRSVVNARRAIADFVESNAPRLNTWLERVAEGIPKRGEDGRKLVDNQGSVIYVVKPDPATAMKLVGDLCEYHLPKLSRSEVDLVDRSALPVEQLSTDELRQRLLIQMGIGAEVVEVMPVEVPVEVPKT